MTLRPETTYEYYFRSPSMYYCKDHDVFRVINDGEDSVLLNGIDSKTVNSFIEHYFEYVLDNPELKDYFVKSLRLKQLEKEPSDAE